MDIKVEVKRLESAKGIPLPDYQTAHAAGLDLVAVEELTLAPGERGAVGTGLTVAIPEGFELQVRPRSGLAIKHGITLVNTPGTIDADYRGEIRILLINHGKQPFKIRRGERVAQALLAPVTRIVWDEVEKLPESDRGAGGFGSTGR
ncbi:MAG: dUTP diphosphatase [Deltaproteobacteria bacterium]|nr:MAG: dUTP diphosphatase [Deltaproteobacteria bacterium]